MSEADPLGIGVGSDRRLTIERARNGVAVAMAFRPGYGFRLLRGRVATYTEEGVIEQSDGPDESWLWARPDGWTPYPVLRRRSLADEFESLGRKPTPTPVRATADRLGWLTGPQLFWARVPARPGDPSRVLEGEPVAMWAKEARAFRDLRETWRATEALRQARAEGLLESPETRLLHAKLTLIGDALRYRPSAAPGMGSDVDADILVPLLDDARRELRRGGLVVMGRFIVAHEINERLRGHVNPVLMPFSGGPQTWGVDRVFEPDTVLTAIYWQFAAEVTASARNPLRRQCANPECDREVSGRPDKKFHSEYCAARYRDLKRTGRLA